MRCHVSDCLVKQLSECGSFCCSWGFLTTQFVFLCELLFFFSLTKVTDTCEHEQFLKLMNNCWQAHCRQMVRYLFKNTNNNVHLSCAHQRPERSHDTYFKCPADLSCWISCLFIICITLTIIVSIMWMDHTTSLPPCPASSYLYYHSRSRTNTTQLFCKHAKGEKVLVLEHGFTRLMIICGAK